MGFDDDAKVKSRGHAMTKHHLLNPLVGLGRLKTFIEGSLTLRQVVKALLNLSALLLAQLCGRGDTRLRKAAHRLHELTCREKRVLLSLEHTAKLASIESCDVNV